MESGQAHPDGHPLRILIVEDDDDSALSLAYLLEDAGHRVQIAADGPTALKFFQTGSAVDVVLLDIGLPIMDGFAVARQIRAMHLPRRPLLVAVTGHGQRSDRISSYEAGIDLHLVKPVEIEDLKAILKRFQALSAEKSWSRGA